MFGQVRKIENQEPPSARGLVITVSKKTIDCICSTNNAHNNNITKANANTVELALEINIKEVQITAANNKSENKSVPRRSANHFIRSTSLSSTHSSTHSATNSPTHSISPSRAHRSSPKGKEKVVEVTLPDEEAKNNPETAAEAAETAEEETKEDEEEEAEEENKNTDNEDNKNNIDAMDNIDQEEGDKQDLYPNARMPANNTIKAFNAAILKHQIKQQEKM